MEDMAVAEVLNLILRRTVGNGSQVGLPFGS